MGMASSLFHRVGVLPIIYGPLIIIMVGLFSYRSLAKADVKCLTIYQDKGGGSRITTQFCYSPFNLDVSRLDDVRPSRELRDGHWDGKHVQYDVNKLSFEVNSDYLAVFCRGHAFYFRNAEIDVEYVK